MFFLKVWLRHHELASCLCHWPSDLCTAGIFGAGKTRSLAILLIALSCKLDSRLNVAALALVFIAMSPAIVQRMGSGVHGHA